MAGAPEHRLRQRDVLAKGGLKGKLVPDVPRSRPSPTAVQNAGSVWSAIICLKQNNVRRNENTVYPHVLLIRNRSELSVRSKEKELKI